jgi:chromosome segregation ATPase
MTDDLEALRLRAEVATQAGERQRQRAVEAESQLRSLTEEFAEYRENTRDYMRENERMKGSLKIFAQIRQDEESELSTQAEELERLRDALNAIRIGGDTELLTVENALELARQALQPPTQQGEPK